MIAILRGTAVLVLVAGCSLPDRPSATPPPPASTTPTAAASSSPRSSTGTTTGLTAALLTAAEVGPGFARAPEQAITSSSLKECPNLDDLPEAGDGAEVVYQEQNTVFVTESLTTGPTAGLDRVLSGLQAAPTRCASFTGHMLRQNIMFRLRRLSLPTVGADRAGFVLTAEVSGVPLLTEYVAAVRTGEVLMVLSYAGLEQTDAATFTRLVVLADTKVARR